MVMIITPISSNSTTCAVKVLEMKYRYGETFTGYCANNSSSHTVTDQMKWGWKIQVLLNIY